MSMIAEHTFVPKRNGKTKRYVQPAKPHIPDVTKLNGDEKKWALQHGKAMEYITHTFKNHCDFESDVNNPQLLEHHLQRGACHMHSIIIAHHYMQPVKGATSFIMIASDQTHPQINAPISDFQEISPSRKGYKLRYRPMPKISINIDESKMKTVFPFPVLVSREFIDGDFTNWHIVPAPFISHFEYKRICKYAEQFTPEFFSREAKQYFPACTRCHQTLLHQAFAPVPDLLPEAESSEGKKALQAIRDHCKKLKKTLNEMLREICGRTIDYDKIQEFVMPIIAPEFEDDTVSIATSGNDAW